MKNGADLVLFGFEGQGQENLSLRLLASAVETAGFRAEIAGYGDLEEAHRLIEKAVKGRPRVMGFSCQEPAGAVHALAHVRLARLKGYEGFIVCGGAFASLQADWILEHSDSVDGVIRHSGEGPMVALLRALREGTALAEVPSLTTRSLCTPASYDPECLAWKPKRDCQPEVMGVAVADVISGRGCPHKCDYCVHAAQAALVAREVQGTSTIGTVPDAGFQRRPIEDLAEEMAELFHGRRVRHFNFIDEHPIPPGEPAALDWCRNLSRHLAQRSVNGITLGMMTRADQLTERVAAALAQLGLVKTLTGFESSSDVGLRALGRTGDPEKGMQGLRLLERSGVVTIFNSLVLHPHSTFDSIENELSVLGRVEGALFETVQVLPFSGTELYRRMEQAQRLEGGSILPSFSFEDSETARFREGLSALQARVFGSCGPSFRLHDLLFSGTLALRRKESPSTRRVLKDLRGMIRRVNRARVRALRSLLENARRGESFETSLAHAEKQFEVIFEELESARRDLLRVGEGSLATTLRNLAAAAAIVFAVGGAASCHKVQAPDSQSDAGETDGDSDSDSDVDSDADGDSDADTDTGTGEPDCAADEYAQDEGALRDLIESNCGFWDNYPTVVITLDSAGAVAEVELDGGATEPWMLQTIQCYEDLLDGEVFPCLAGEELWFYPAMPGIE